MSFDTVDKFFAALEGDGSGPPDNWKTRLSPGSFRGVPFHTLNDGYTFGRRLEVNEYPGRDIPHTKDLGRRADRFAIEAFVLGEDYDLKLAALIKALRAGGPGELVTERHGTHRVAILGGTVRQSGREGRWAKITFQAVESGFNRTPAKSSATKDLVKKAAKDAQEGALVSFLLKVQDGVGWVQKNVVAASQDGLELFDRGLALYQRGPKAIALGLKNTALASSIAFKDTQRQTFAFAETGSAIIDLYDDMSALPDSAKDRLRILEGMRHDGETVSDSVLGPDLGRNIGVTLSADASIASANRAALADLIRQSIVIARGLALLDATLRSAEETDRLREDFLSPIDDEIETAGLSGDDDAYISLREFRAAVLVDLAVRGDKTPDQADFILPTSMSSLMLSHRLYGTGDRADELVANIVPDHPAFIGALTKIRVPRV